MDVTKKELKQMYYDMVAVRYDFSAEVRDAAMFRD